MSSSEDGMSILSELTISTLLFVGACFVLVGSLALIRLPDPMQRLHGPTKATTLGVGAILVASMLHRFVESGKPSYHELLIAIFLFITAPISAHLIAKACLHLKSARRD